MRSGVSFILLRGRGERQTGEVQTDVPDGKMLQKEPNCSWNKTLPSAGNGGGGRKEKVPLFPGLLGPVAAKVT